MSNHLTAPGGSVESGSGRLNLLYFTCLEGSGSFNLPYFTCLEGSGMFNLTFFSCLGGGGVWGAQPLTNHAYRVGPLEKEPTLLLRARVLVASEVDLSWI